MSQVICSEINNVFSQFIPNSIPNVKKSSMFHQIESESMYQ